MSCILVWLSFSSVGKCTYMSVWFHACRH